MAGESERTYKIGQVAQLLQIEPYVLRFWESEFEQLKPIRTPKGQRLYTDEHIRLIRRIKHLLYQQGLTIAGARKKLQENQQWWDRLEEIREELERLKRILEGESNVE
ncbi:MAG: MerR family transcriptional regulator [Thermodesulfobacteriota bacterium]